MWRLGRWVIGGWLLAAATIVAAGEPPPARPLGWRRPSQGSSTKRDSSKPRESPQAADEIPRIRLVAGSDEPGRIDDVDDTARALPDAEKPSESTSHSADDTIDAPSDAAESTVETNTILAPGNLAPAKRTTRASRAASGKPTPTTVSQSRQPVDGSEIEEGPIFGESESSAGPGAGDPNLRLGLSDAPEVDGEWTSYAGEDGGWLAGFGSRFEGLVAPIDDPWIIRPAHVGMFLGGTTGEGLIPDRVTLDGGVIGGLRIGWDWNEFWGAEFRFGWAGIEVNNLGSQPNPRTADVYLGDASLRFYPWSTQRWRPHLMLGLGLADRAYADDQGRPIRDTQLSFPIGLGFSWRYSEELIFRFDFLDQIIAGEGQAVTTHELTYLGGVEYYFGNPRRSYWPWNPSAR